MLWLPSAYITLIPPPANDFQPAKLGPQPIHPFYSNLPFSPFLPCVLPYIFPSSPQHFLHLWFILLPSHSRRTTIRLHAPPRKRCLILVAPVAYSPVVAL